MRAMGEVKRRSTQEQLDDLVARFVEADADIAALQEGARAASLRADVSEGLAAGESKRIDALEARAGIDREMIRELQADGLVAQEHVANLEAALQTARMIGAAVGIIMSFYGVPEIAAFDILRKASMDRNVKLRAVADEVVQTGSAGGLPPRHQAG